MSQDIHTQIRGALQKVSDILDAEKPIILFDPRHGEYLLLLKGLTEATLNMNARDPAMLPVIKDRAARYFKSIETVLPFLHQNGLTHGDCRFDTYNTDDGQYITCIEMPGGHDAVENLKQTFQDYDVPNPFTIMTSMNDHGLVNDILRIQEIGQQRKPQRKR